MVGVRRFELRASASQTQRSTKLSYTPTPALISMACAPTGVRGYPDSTLRGALRARQRLGVLIVAAGARPLLHPRCGGGAGVLMANVERGVAARAAQLGKRDLLAVGLRPPPECDGDRSRHKQADGRRSLVQSPKTHQPRGRDEPGRRRDDREPDPPDAGAEGRP